APFGEELTSARTSWRTTAAGYYGADSFPLKFTGKERDTLTELDYFGARYYGSSYGRFESPDPLTITEDRLREPQRLNLYQYGRNNPLSFIDPTGLDDIYYDHGGNEIEEQRVRKKWWQNLLFGNTHYLRAADGRTYQLESALVPLKNGERYTVVSSEQTQAILSSFLIGKARSGLSMPAGPSTVLQNSPEGARWDFKNTDAARSLGHPLFALGDGKLYLSDYVGNVAWGYIMASNLWPESVAMAGAGLYQLGPGRERSGIVGPAWCFYDDCRDTRAIGRGYGMFRRKLTGLR
ncbi:MAG: polymorphic toxin type 44 domain-containing protein, partial [Acidobacteriales bacterium]|nr:polymorphic toxin type 44 domain-containing protein [Terriglobales bacterium]